MSASIFEEVDDGGKSEDGDEGVDDGGEGGAAAELTAAGVFAGEKVLDLDSHCRFLPLP